MEIVVEELFKEITSSQLDFTSAQKVCEAILICIYLLYHKTVNESTQAEQASGLSLDVSVSSRPTLTYLKQCFLEELQTIAERIFMQLCNKGEHIQSMVDFLLKNHCDEISLQFAADYLDVHPTYLSISFREKTGVYFKDYVLNYKMSAAKRLLADSQKKIHEISLALGYQNADHFSRVFRKHYNITPSQYRNNSMTP